MPHEQESIKHIAHELANVFAVITGSAAIVAQMCTADSPDRVFFDAIEEAASRGTALARDLATIAGMARS